MSVPPGVERIVLSLFMTVSVFERYRGSQLRKVWRDGGVGGVGRGTGAALSGCVSGGGRPWISDMLKKYHRSEVR